MFLSNHFCLWGAIYSQSRPSSSSLWLCRGTTSWFTNRVGIQGVVHVKHNRKLFFKNGTDPIGVCDEWRPDYSQTGVDQSTTNIFSVWKWPFTISVVWEMAIHNLRGLGHPNSQKPLVTLGEPRKLLRWTHLCTISYKVNLSNDMFNKWFHQGLLIYPLPWKS